MLAHKLKTVITLSTVFKVRSDLCNLTWPASPECAQKIWKLETCQVNWANFICILRTYGQKPHKSYQLDLEERLSHWLKVLVNGHGSIQHLKKKKRQPPSWMMLTSAHTTVQAAHTLN